MSSNNIMVIGSTINSPNWFSDLAKPAPRNKVEAQNEEGCIIN